MWRYLKGAFWARPEIPGLGRIPANALFLAGFAVLGLGHPGFWMVGLAMETAYLYALSTSERFQRWIDAGDEQVSQLSIDQQRTALVQSLTPPRRRVVGQLEEKCSRILQLHQDNQTDQFVVDADQTALQKLAWLHLKLLVAQQNIATLNAGPVENDLRRQIEEIRDALGREKISASLRDSRQATLKILEQRLANLARREQTLEEIASDITRIEAQVDLALENAGMQGRTEAISANIDLASQLLDDSVFGDSSGSIAALEQNYSVKN